MCYYGQNDNATLFKKGDILKSEKRVLYSPKRLRGSPKRQSAQGYLIIYVHTTYVTLYHRASEVEVATEASLTLLCGACRHKSNGGKKIVDLILVTKKKFPRKRSTCPSCGSRKSFEVIETF